MKLNFSIVAGNNCNIVNEEKIAIESNAQITKRDKMGNQFIVVELVIEKKNINRMLH